MSNNPKPKQAPALNIPKSSSTVEVAIINTTCDLVVPPETLIEPPVDGHEWLNLPTYAFLINHPNGSQLLFDFGSRADWSNFVPHVEEVVSQRVPGLNVREEVPDILKKGGVDPSKLKALVLSHWHFDHSGNISRLAPSTDLIVGPGFKNAFEPGYPKNQGSVFYEEDFKGRNVIEPDFSDDFKIGKYQAHDYFGDGSFYVLNVPGHTTGHISALARTTDGSFIFMGGDVCHFTGVIRPTDYIPMPDPLPKEAVLDKRFSLPCPCSIFTACHPNQTNSRTTPFYQCSTGPHSWYDDAPKAMESIRALFEFDADPSVLVLIAHDTAPLDTLPFFPNGTINDWQKKGYKQTLHWGFVNELPVKGKQERENLTDGLYKDGKKIKTLTGEPVNLPKTVV